MFENYPSGSRTERGALRSMKLGMRMKSSSRCEAKGWGWEWNKAGQDRGNGENRKKNILVVGAGRMLWSILFPVETTQKGFPHTEPQLTLWDFSSLSKQELPCSFVQIIILKYVNITYDPWPCPSRNWQIFIFQTKIPWFFPLSHMCLYATDNLNRISVPMLLQPQLVLDGCWFNNWY